MTPKQDHSEDAVMHRFVYSHVTALPVCQHTILLCLQTTNEDNLSQALYVQFAVLASNKKVKRIVIRRRSKDQLFLTKPINISPLLKLKVPSKKPLILKRNSLKHCRVGYVKARIKDYEENSC